MWSSYFDQEDALPTISFTGVLKTDWKEMWCQAVYGSYADLSPHQRPLDSREVPTWAGQEKKVMPVVLYVKCQENRDGEPDLAP